MDSPAVLTRAQVRELDRRAIHEFGIPSFTLMENAARACADEAERLLRIHSVQREMTRLGRPGSRDDIPRTLDELQRWKTGLRFSEHPALLLCGPGNNGGDGLAIARTLFNRGHGVEVVLAGPPGCLRQAGPEVQLNANLLRALGVGIREVSTGPQVRELEPLFANTHLIIDAMFGTGLTRPLGDPWLALIQTANDARATRMAVDIPSGLDADTGEVLGLCFRADVTVTFVALKPGFLIKAGPSCCGKVSIAEIGIPRPWIDRAP